MKTCEHCGSTTFDDMETCFDCMNMFMQPPGSTEKAHEPSVARLEVALVDCFCYELLLHKLEGRSLSIGSAAQNAIVIPGSDIAEHQLEVFYAHGEVWVETVDTSPEVLVGEHPLKGKTSITPGTQIKLGQASITVLEV